MLHAYGSYRRAQAMVQFFHLHKEKISYAMYIWKMKVPLEDQDLHVVPLAQFFLAKDNLVNRNWTGCKKYVFNEDELV